MLITNPNTIIPITNPPKNIMELLYNVDNREPLDKNENSTIKTTKFKIPKIACVF